MLHHYFENQSIYLLNCDENLVANFLGHLVYIRSFTENAAVEHSEIYLLTICSICICQLAVDVLMV